MYQLPAHHSFCFVLLFSIFCPSTSIKCFLCTFWRAAWLDSCLDLSNDPIFPIFYSPLQGFKNTAAQPTLTLKSTAPVYRQEQRQVGKLARTLWGTSKSAEATARGDSEKIHSPFQRGEIHCMSTLYRPVFPLGEAKGRKEHLSSIKEDTQLQAIFYS